MPTAWQACHSSHYVAAIIGWIALVQTKIVSNTLSTLCHHFSLFSSRLICREQREQSKVCPQITTKPPSSRILAHRHQWTVWVDKAVDRQTVSLQQFAVYPKYPKTTATISNISSSSIQQWKAVFNHQSNSTFCVVQIIIAILPSLLRGKSQLTYLSSGARMTTTRHSFTLPERYQKMTKEGKRKEKRDKCCKVKATAKCSLFLAINYAHHAHRIFFYSRHNFLGRLN